MSHKTFDVAVVGVGAMGSATCDALARRGASVIGFEAVDVPHDLGSSGGHSRLIREAYWEHPDYVPLLGGAVKGWLDLQERIGRDVLLRPGCVYAGPADGSFLEGTRLAVRTHGLDVEEVPRAEAASRFDAFSFPDEFEVMFEPGAGLVLCERAIAGFAQEARKRGSEIRCRESVLCWEEDGDGVRIETERDTVEAGAVVFTAGAWTSRLLAGIGVPLRVHRQVIAWVWPEDIERHTIGTMPCWAIQPSDPGFEGIYYGFPALPVETAGGIGGMKLGRHWLGPEVDPDTVDRRATAADEESWRPALASYFPGAVGAPTAGMKVCLYTSTPDEHFVVDRLPGSDRVTIACGFSGHGFKFASIMGEALADLALEGRSDLPIDFLGLQRFSEAAP